MKNKLKKGYLEKIAKHIVLHCFRNTHLEDLHAGKRGGGAGGGFDDKEMKKLMIECVNKVYTFLYALHNDGFSKEMEWWINVNYPKDWDNPKLDKTWLKR